MARLSAFNPHEFSEATLRAVATGRQDDLTEILRDVCANLGAQTIQHLIVSAPPGYGKSFLMRHAQLEIERVAREEKRALVVVLMPEEMPHVKEPETLIREILRTFSGGAGAEAALSWHEDDGELFDAAAQALKKAIAEKVGDTGLCVALIENFDALLRRAFPKDVQRSRLREVLAAPDGRLMLIAASASGAFDRDYDSRLFQTFKEIALKPWTVDECLEFFDRQRKDAHKPPLDEVLRARAKAVVLYIGGAPRLATLLGEQWLGEDRLGAAGLLKRLVDELTPYYKERIEALPGRSQKLLDALLRGGEPATPSELARRVNANSQAAIAGPFQDLVKQRVVIGERATGSAEMLYRVADRVFASYYRFRVVDHGRDLCSLEGLVDLLAEFFTPEEMRNKASEGARIGRVEDARVMARLADRDIRQTPARRAWIVDDLERDYVPRCLVPLIDEAMGRVLGEAADEARAGAFDAARARVAAALATADKLPDRVALLLLRSRLDACEGFDGGLVAAREAVEAAKGATNSHIRLVAENGHAWCLIQSDRLDEALAEARRLAAQAVKATDFGEEIVARRLAAFSLGQLGRSVEAITEFRRVAELAAQAGDVSEEGKARRYAGDILADLRRYAEAVDEARQAKALAAKAGDVREEAAARRDLAWSLGRLGRHNEAIAEAGRAAALAAQAGKAGEEAAARRQAAWSLAQLRRHDEAVSEAGRAAELAAQASDAGEIAVARRLAAWSLGALGRHADALAEAGRAAAPIQRAPDGSGAGGRFIESERLNLLTDAGVLGLRAASSLSAVAPSDVLATVHGLFTRSAEFGHGGFPSKVLAAWLTGFVEQLLRRATSPDFLDAIAEAMAIHFPDCFTVQRKNLVEAAAYHRSGPSRVALQRLDPDFSQALVVMHPPREGAGQGAGRKTRASRKSKRT